MKKPINNIDDVFYYVSKECGVSEDVVRHVWSDLWYGVRYFLSNPIECGHALLLNKFLKFYLSEKKLYRYITQVRNGKRKEPKQTLGFYEELFEIATGETYDSRNEKIKNRKNGKRQESKES